MQQDDQPQQDAQPQQAAQPQQDAFTQAHQDAAQPQPNPRPTLQEGFNYRLIQGQRANSKLIVFERYTYLLDKMETYDQVKAKFYLRCKYPSCPARAVIKEGTLSMKPDDRDLHTCAATEGASQDKILYQEALTRMKKRAASEATTYHVRMSNL